MDYRGALLKGLKVIPSSPSIKSRPRPVFKRNWLDLPPEVMVSILQGVGSSDVLLNAKFVCKSWHSLCKDPHVWQVVELRRDVLSNEIIEKEGFLPLAYGEMDKVLQKMAMQVVDLSSGQLLDLCIQGFGSNHLFQYIYQRSSKLRRLRLEDCRVCIDYSRLQDEDCRVCIDSSRLQDEDSIYHEGLSHMLRNLPLLEDLELPFTGICEEGIESAGRCCPNLKSFSCVPETDCEAIAIAKYMPGLRKLQLFGNGMTVVGLTAILDNCRYLEYLDLQQCHNLCKALKKESKPETKLGQRHGRKVLTEETDLKTRLRQQIKHVRFPEDHSTEDYKFDDWFCDSDYHQSSCMIQ